MLEAVHLGRPLALGFSPRSALEALSLLLLFFQKHGEHPLAYNPKD